MFVGDLRFEDFGLGHAGIPRLNPLAQRVESPLHATNALEETGVSQGSNRPPSLLITTLSWRYMHNVEHLAQVLTEGDGTRFGDHGFLQQTSLITMVITWMCSAMLAAPKRLNPATQGCAGGER